MNAMSREQSSLRSYFDESQKNEIYFLIEGDSEVKAILRPFCKVTQILLVGWPNQILCGASIDKTKPSLPELLRFKLQNM